MSPPNVCTAGLNLGNLRHVRPFPQSGHLTASHLHRSGGILRLARVIRFVSTHPRGRPPEVEDLQATFRTAQTLEDLPAPEFWNRIDRVAHSGNACLRSAMGNDLQRRGLTHAVSLEQGSASLGLLRVPASAIELKVRERTQYNKHPQVRAHVAPGALDDVVHGPNDLPVTDIRLYGEDQAAANEQTTADANILLRNSRAAILAIGLTRPFAKGDGPPMHWLQVNGVFPDVDPLWNA